MCSIAQYIRGTIWVRSRICRLFRFPAMLTSPSTSTYWLIYWWFCYMCVRYLSSCYVNQSVLLRLALNAGYIWLIDGILSYSQTRWFVLRRKAHGVAGRGELRWRWVCVRKAEWLGCLVSACLRSGVPDVLILGLGFLYSCVLWMHTSFIFCLNQSASLSCFSHGFILLQL